MGNKLTRRNLVFNSASLSSALLTALTLFDLAGAPRLFGQTVNTRFAFNDSGTTTTDSVSGVVLNLSSNSLPLDFHGAAGSGPGNIGGSLNFPGTYGVNGGAIAQSQGGNGVNLGTISNFTVCFWLKPTATLQTANFERFLVIGTNGTTDFQLANTLGVCNNGNRAGGGLTNSIEPTLNTQNPDVTTFGVAPIPINIWSFLALTYDGTNLRYYVGTETSSVQLISTAAIAGQTVRLGTNWNILLGNRSASSGNRAYKGYMADVRFYTGAGDSSFVEGLRVPAGAILTAPVNLTATSCGQSSLAWSPVAGATGYVVKRSMTTGTETNYDTTSLTSYNDMKVTVGTMYYYKIIATNMAGNASASSSEISVTINGFNFITQPANQAVNAGSTATFSVAASGEAGLTYQWQSSHDAGVTWGNLAGATNTTYMTAPVINSNNGTQYRVVINGSCGSIASVAAVLTVTPSFVNNLALQFGFEDTGTSTTDSVSGVSLNLVGSTGTASDLHGGANSGVNGHGKALSFLSGNQGGAGPLAFAAANSAINFGIVSNFTVTMWLNPATPLNVAATWPRYFILGTNGVTDYAVSNSLGLVNDANTYQPGGTTALNAYVNTYNVSQGSWGGFNIPTNQWTFLAVTYDGRSLNFYGGNAATAATVMSSAGFQAGPINLGNSFSLFLGNRNGRDRSLAGLLDDVRFYTAAEDGNFVESVRQAALFLVAPTNLAAAGCNQASVSWMDSVAGATGYIVKRSTIPGMETNYDTTGVPDYFDKNVTPGVTYYYVVCATNASFVSAPSREISVAIVKSFTFDTEPASQVACMGSMAFFSVSTSGGSGLAFQWQLSTNGGVVWSNLTGATNTTFTTTPVSLADNSSQYRVVVSSSCGLTFSAIAGLTVIPPPSIFAQPVSQTISTNGTAQFWVQAAAAQTYQWQQNGTNLVDGAVVSGSTSQFLTLSNVPATYSGYTYDCLVGSLCEVVTSSLPATLTVYTSLALSNSANTQIQYLSGTDKDHTVPWQFICTGGGRSNNVWTTIPVPSCWQTKGFGNYTYGFDSPSKSVGQYSTIFSVPASWAGKRIYLVYEGVLTDTATMINGQAIGAPHQGGFYEFSYEVTTNVMVGALANVLNATVSEWSSNASVNLAERSGDYWNFSGIFRPVYLMAKPASNIERLAVDAQASGQLNVNVFLSGMVGNGLVVASVTDTNNLPLGSPFTNMVSVGATNVLLSAALPAPQLWSAEFPNLYTLTVQLLDTNGGLIHTVSNSIGFRTITFSNNVGFMVNGKKVLLRGVDRHEVWPTDGRTTSQFESELDVRLIKDMNFNAVRLTSYPHSKSVLEECDRLGLYALEELAGWQTGLPYDNTIAPELVREMVIRDVSHPCIIAWDNGNEGGWNTNVDTNYAIWDPQNRKVLHPGAGVANLYDEHYPPYNTFTSRFGTNQTVYLPTEILHGLYDGGGGASLSEFWNVMRTSPNGAGMFLWAYLDEGIVRDDLGGALDVKDTLAPDGVVGPYRQPEASYYSYKSIYNPVQVTSPNLATFNGTLAVENRYDFTRLDQCTFDWQLGWFPDLNDPASTFSNSTNALTGGFLTAVDSGSFAGPALVPGATGLLRLPGLPTNNGTNYDALRLTATDPFGNNLYTWTWPFHTPGQIHDRILGAVAATAPFISAGTNASEIIVSNGPRVLHFSKTTGLINSVTVSNQPVSFTNGPVLVTGSWGVTSVTNYYDGTNYIIMVNNLSNAPNAFQWRLRPDGWLNLTYVYTLTGTQNFMGITFNYPSNQVTAMSWLGQGPFRIYKNRTEGQEVFVHTKAYNNTWTGQGSLIAPSTTPWVYPEFAGCYGQLNWATLQTTEQPITFVTSTTNLFLRVLTPPATDLGNVNPPYPSGAISLLHGITPIGDKFHPAGSYGGPAAAINTANGLYAGTVDLFFGTPPASGADRDGNGLVDAWELEYFGALGQYPNADPYGTGVRLGLDNAFDISPMSSDPNISRLPKAGAGTITPVALIYRVPNSQMNYFNYIPQISDSLFLWYGADQYPQYFLVNFWPTNGTENAYAVEANLPAWPGNTNHLFLRLRIDKK